MDSDARIQYFINSLLPSLPSRAIVANPSTDLRHLKLSFFSPSIPPPQTLDSLFFTCSGKPLPDSSTLLDCRVSPLSTLTLHHRLPGGGGDGGATGAESRDCYLNMYAVKKPDKVDPNETRLSKWTTCALSSQPLNPPCVLDKLGNIFNKQPLVEALISKKLPKELSHIKGLKDMIPIQLSVIPGMNSNEEISYETRFECPISGLEFNGKYKFLALRGCGHVLSAKALKEVKSSACLVCHRLFSDSDKMVINGDKDEVAELRAKMVEEKASLQEKREKRKKGGHDEKLAVVSEDRNRKVGNFGDGVKEGSAKKFEAVDLAPANATKEVFASIFTSSKKIKFKETYSCRSLPLGRN